MAAEILKVPRFWWNSVLEGFKRHWLRNEAQNSETQNFGSNMADKMQNSFDFAIIRHPAASKVSVCDFFTSYLKNNYNNNKLFKKTYWKRIPVWLKNEENAIHISLHHSSYTRLFDRLSCCEYLVNNILHSIEL